MLESVLVVDEKVLLGTDAVLIDDDMLVDNETLDDDEVLVNVDDCEEDEDVVVVVVVVVLWLTPMPATKFAAVAPFAGTGVCVPFFI